MKVRAVVFDLDGVLVDACEIHYETLNAALRQIANYEISRRDHETVYNGLPTRVKLADLAANGRIRLDQVIAISDLKQQLTVSEISKQVKQDVSKIEMMKYLKSKGIKIGCYTNAVRESAELMLKLCGVWPYIMVLLTNEDVKICKPDPCGYKLAFKLLDVQPEEALVVEDSPKGIDAAVQARAAVLEVGSARDVNVGLFRGKIA